jgi:hypothetical protein
MGRLLYSTLTLAERRCAAMALQWMVYLYPIKIGF